MNRECGAGTINVQKRHLFSGTRKGCWRRSYRAL
jgi:hypothetical protein